MPAGDAPASADGSALERARARAEALTRAGACVLLLGGPVVLAFADGGIADDPRAATALAAWVLVGAGALTWRSPPLPRGGAGRAAVGALAALALTVALSGLWAPLGGPALDDRVRLAGYLAAFVLAASAWPSRAWARRVEPALVLGAIVVLGYGLSERLLPDLVSLQRAARDTGLLKQPLSYWNATGALAALAIVLAARLVGDSTRRPGTRTSAAAALVPLGAALALTQSRGAVVACAAGLAVLVLLAPERRQARAALLAFAAGTAGGIVAAVPSGVRVLEGGLTERRVQGIAVLLALALLGAGAAVAERRLVRARGRTGLPRPGRALAPLALIALLALAVPAVAGGGGRGLGGNREDYWSVSLSSFADHPVAGAGSGAFVVEWARERTIDESVRDAHSLYLETAGELGLAGLLALGLFGAALLAAGRAAHRRDAVLAAGPCAGLAVYALHAAVDWDWEVPALTLPVLTLAGLLVWRAET